MACEVPGGRYAGGGEAPADAAAADEGGRAAAAERRRRILRPRADRNEGAIHVDSW